MFLSQTSLLSTLCFLFYFVPPVPQHRSHDPTPALLVCSTTGPKQWRSALRFSTHFVGVCLFVCFCNDAVSDLGRAWVEAGVAPYKVPFRPLAGGTDKTTKCQSRDNRFAVSPSLVPNVSQMNPIHIRTLLFVLTIFSSLPQYRLSSSVPNVHKFLRLILASILGSSQVSFSVLFKL